MGNRTESRLMIAKVEITKEMYHLTLKGKWLFDKIVTKQTYTAEIDEYAAGCKEGLCGIKTATYIYSQRPYIRETINSALDL